MHITSIIHEKVLTGKLILKVYSSRLLSKEPLRFNSVTKQCLEIANSANFSTNYEDVHEHLSDCHLIALILSISECNKEIIKGFACFAKCIIPTQPHIVTALHLHGIILSPDIQNQGICSKILTEMISFTQPNYITAKTQNPSLYASFLKVIPKNSFPSLDGYETPDYVIEIIHKHPFLTNAANPEMIYPNAYSTSKVHQQTNNEKVNNLFKTLNPNDAQAIIVQI